MAMKLEIEINTIYGPKKECELNYRFNLNNTTQINWLVEQTVKLINSDELKKPSQIRDTGIRKLNTADLLKSKRMREWISRVVGKPIEAIDRVSEVYLSLSSREMKVINMRFGLDDGITHTLEETAKEVGVTRERIRQIEAKIEEKLKQVS